MEFARKDDVDRSAAVAVTDLILRVFRTNGALLAAGDRLVEGLGLTSARWQLLGGIATATEPLSVAELARQIGVTRQAVQRIANDLQAAGLIAFCPNPRHKRAQLMELTERGRALSAQAIGLQEPWAANLSSKLSARQIEVAYDTLTALLAALEVAG